MINKQSFVVAIIMLFIIGIIELSATPAFPRKIKVYDAYGREVYIYMRGDENIKYATTLDGYTLLSNAEGWWYASVADNGEVVKSDFMLVADRYESAELKKFKLECPKGIVPLLKSENQSYKALSIRKSSQNTMQEERKQ